MSKDEKHIDDLIAKHLAGEATPKEEQQLKQWMEESAENKKYFGDIQFVHDKAIASHKYVRVDTEGAWSKVKGQMSHVSNITNAKQTRLIPTRQWYWWSIAAILIVALASISVLYTLITKQDKITTTAYTITTKKESVSHTFAGNTNICLNRNSAITLKQNKRERKKELILSGEVYIQHKHSVDTSLIVRADETFIKDIGTNFNIKAYPGSSTIEVYVECGEVVFYTEKLSGITLIKGETGIFDKQAKVFRKSSLANQNTISYKTHKFVFVNTRLADAIEELNAVYPEPIILENPDLANCSITVTFDNESITAIVDIMTETLGLSFVKTSDGFALKGVQCSSK